MKQHYKFSDDGGTATAVKPSQVIEDVDFILIDLFCGAGGTTTGFDKAWLNGKKVAIIAACINHDFKAIKSHWMNHPDVEHYEEDITKMYGMVESFKIWGMNAFDINDFKYYNLLFRSDEMIRLERLINIYRAFYPNAKVILWASLECTNFSKAKGGKPRDQDSRTLADHLDRYIFCLNPDYVQIENVVEFMSWGPLNELGKPISKKSGSDYLRWKNHIDEYGYYNDWKELNSADYGAYTSRNRLFGCFAKHCLPIIWPDATHSKKAKKDIKTQSNLFGDLFTDQAYNAARSLAPWKPVKDVLDFDDEGNSIFNRKIPLSEKTLERIYAGLLKYVAGGKDKFMQQIYACTSANSASSYSTDQPARTLTTRDSTAIIGTSFISQYNTGQPESRNFSVNNPCRCLLTANTYSLIQAEPNQITQYSFIAKYYSGKPDGKVTPVTEPLGTLRTKDGQSLIQCFLAKYYGANDQVSSINEPCGTLTTKARFAKIWLDKSYSSKHNHQSINEPCGTLLSKDKFATIQTFWLDRNFTTGGQHSSIDKPAGSILSVPKINLVKCEPFILDTNFNNLPKSINEPAPTLLASRRHYNIVRSFILNPSHGGCCTGVDVPGPVVIARQDKAPLYITNVISGALENDMSTFLHDIDKHMFYEYYCFGDVYGPKPKKSIRYLIVEFMLMYRIRDIKMRMLKVPELLKIQGFPDDYKLFGNQSDQKKFIGNSVHPLVPKYWSESLAAKLRQMTTLN